MGMYDEVMLRCPECETLFTEQSKAGDCNLHCYNLDQCPPEILIDMSKEAIYCPKCRTELILKTHVEVTANLIKLEE